MTVPTEVAGRYRMERRLGAGGMSTVFLATDTVLERSVAVKLLAEHLADDEAFVARFRREALAAARLQHPNIVQVFDSGQDSESRRHYIVMEYVDGPSCADLLRERQRLEVEETVHVVRDACHGLDYAHRAGVVHRDVKPGNLLVAQDTDTTKLADFGIAKAAEQTRITQVGSVLGHRRLPLTRAGPRRRGGTGVGHLLAGGLRLPAAHRKAAPRVRVAHRAGPQAAAGHGGADRRAPAGGPARAGRGRAAVPRARAGGPLRLGTRARPRPRRRAARRADGRDGAPDPRRHRRDPRARQHLGHPRSAPHRLRAPRVPARPGPHDRPSGARATGRARRVPQGGEPTPLGDVPGSAGGPGRDRRRGRGPAVLRRRERRRAGDAATRSRTRSRACATSSRTTRSSAQGALPASTRRAKPG